MYGDILQRFLQGASWHATLQPLEPVDVSEFSFPSAEREGSLCEECYPTIAAFFAEHFDSSNIQHRQIKIALQKSKELDDILAANHGLNKLPELEADRFLKCAREFLACNQSLGFTMSIQFQYSLNETVLQIGCSFNKTVAHQYSFSIVSMKLY